MKTKTHDRIRNWPKYNAALIGRGSLTLWVEEEARKAWRSTGPTQRGAQYCYTDAAITCVLTPRAVYPLALRATEGLRRSVFAWLAVALPVASSSTLSRRAAAGAVALGAVPRSGPLHGGSDSSGLKVYGEGEWKVRLHGWRTRRTWRTRPSGVDEATGEIVAAVASDAGVSADDALPDVRDPVAGEIGQVSAEGASATRRGDEAIAPHGAKAVIPPRREAKIWQPGNWGLPPLQRAENLRAIRAKGRRQWKKDAGYQRRSLAETAFCRCKTRFGPTVRSRDFPQQATALFIQAAVLNRMAHLGMPDSYRLAV